MKVATRNNLLKKLANSMWGTNARTTRTTALALCYSTAEYAVPVWARSSHANKLNPVLNKACRSITGCLKPTNIEDLYLIAGIAPPDIRKKVCTVRCTNWRARLREKSHIDIGLLTEDLAKDHNSPWLTWRSLNRLRTGFTCSKEQQKK